MKKLFVLTTALILAVSLTACGPDKKDANNGAPLPEGAQPGAKVENFIYEDGQKGYYFKNPDGSGGGGIELD